MPESRTRKAVKFVDEHPVATGAGVIGTAVVGRKYGNLARTGLALRALKQPGRAAKLSRDLAGQRGVGLSAATTGGPFGALKVQSAQRKVYRQAVKTNKDTRKLAPTATRWSQDFRGVRRIKQQDPDAPIKARNVLLHPTRTQAHLDSKVLRTMVKESDVNPTTLYRSHPKGKKMGGLTSFSDDKRTVDTFEGMKGVQTAMMPKKLHGYLGLDSAETHIVQVRPKKMRAVNIGPATPRFAQREWVGEPVGKRMPALPPDGNPIEQLRWAATSQEMNRLSVSEGQRTPAGRAADRWIAEDHYPFEPRKSGEALSDFQSRENYRQAEKGSHARMRRHDRKQRAAAPLRLKRVKGGPYLDNGKKSLPERRAYAIAKSAFGVRHG